MFIKIFLVKFTSSDLNGPGCSLYIYSCGPLEKINKEYKSLNKLEIQDIFTKMN